MIQTKFFRVREDGVILNRTYSDAGMMIRQDGTGAVYDEAIDPEETGRTYTETDIPIEGETAEEIVSILLGGEE